MPNSGTPLEAREPPKRYTKHELIGQGAQKKVYRAFDEERGIEVAWNEVAVAELARFREKDRQRVFAEIRVLKQLKHKNIMSLYDYWFDEPRFMLVFITEIFPDGTLRQYRRRHKLADVPAIKRWAWQILQGLVYLHGHNPPIIHRDLKCDNIFVDGSSGVVKIGDLGLVTLCKDFSAPQSVLGTPEFMAPELYEEKYDEKVDVYAFGMCLLELATMEYPYSECKNAAQIYKKVISGTLPATVEKLASAELRDFVTLCIKHDPATRPEARQLLKHPFFESCRAAAAAAAPGAGGSSGGSAPRLMISPSMSLSNPGTEAAAAAAAAMTAAVEGLAGGFSPAMSGGLLGTPGEMSRQPSQRVSFSGAAGGSFSIAAAAGGGGGVVSGNNTASGAISGAGLIAAAVGGIGGGSGLPVYSRTSSAGSGRSIAAAAGGAGGGGGFGGGDGPAPLGAIAAALTRSQSSASSFGGAAAQAVAGSLSPPISAAAGHGLIAAAAATASPPAPTPAPVSAPMPQLTGRLAELFAGVTPDMLPPQPPAPRISAGGGSIAASVSPPLALGAASIASSVNNNNNAGTAVLYGGSSMMMMGSNPPSIGGSPAPSTLATSLNNQAGGLPHSSLTRQLSPPVGGIAQSLAAAAAVAAVEAAAAPVAAQLPATAAAPADAAAAAAAAGGSGGGGSAGAGGGGGGSVHGAQQYMGFALAPINEDQELLHEEMMFDEHGNRHITVEDDTDDEEGEAGSGEGSSGCTPAAADPGAAAGAKSQPVRMQVRSSGKAAVRDMALSFAMSFTNDRGVRKKVGFQYDLQHDTASAIAVEMVENLSLNTAEAEAIAQMIAHEVSRFGRQQQSQQGAAASAGPGGDPAPRQEARQ
ncbi:hypothetical protein HYH02_006403 [Chlamydomonas schloesseri]|uniref:non-specific serine/threonine protein kinase n=1 Tax=Chlamydomonas schloesseri TaxID=2026947 RepID=A0A835WJ42_9CHLO|nr:hypothetical protein HYH02_006403 [Chlamydomonas schloesseri]|eukprot:KAG2448512.1 hypothetical protein HYH02_006403 [Chlamydomonas schloesseri]